MTNQTAPKPEAQKAPAQKAAKPKAAPKPEPKPQAEPEAQKAPDVLYVTDNNCQPDGPSKMRQHEVLLKNGRIVPYKMHYGEGTELPASHAMRLLHVDGIAIYRDAKMSERIQPTKAIDKTAEKSLNLAPGQVIVHVTELSDKALFDRCLQYPGSENINDAFSRSDIIQFLAEKEGIELTDEEVEQIQEGDFELDETPMDEDELEGLLGGS